MHGRPTPQVLQHAAIHGYTTVFWWCAGIFAYGAVVCGTLLPRGPLARREETVVRAPSPEAAPARQ